MLERHPFPGPGLGVRIVGEISKDKIKVLQEADHIFIEELIKEDPSIEWDISKLRKEIFRKKIHYVTPSSLRDEIVDEAFSIFIKKRHQIELFDGVADTLKTLSEKYILGVLTNGNADIYKFDIGKYFKFAISSLEAKDSKPNRSHFDRAVENVKDIAFDQILHIGDHQVNDILFAHNLDTVSYTHLRAHET